MLAGNGLRHLVIAAHCVTPRLLVNELRHMGKWRLNAGRSPHVEKKDIRENDCHSVEMGYNAGITCRMDTHAHTHTQWTVRQIEDNTTHRWCLR